MRRLTALLLAHARVTAGSIHMEINGESAGSYVQKADDAEGNLRMHMVIPELPTGRHTITMFLADPNGVELEYDRASETVQFDVNPHAPPPGGGDVELHNMARHCPKDAGACKSDWDCNGAKGVCVSGACLCAPNWVGERCTHHILTNTTFLPDVDPAVSKSLCMKTQVGITTRAGARALPFAMPRCAPCPRARRRVTR